MISRFAKPVALVAVLIGNPVTIAAPAAHDSAFEVARRWLSSFQSDDLSAIRTTTAVPFTFATTNRAAKCEGTVKDTSALAEWLKCARQAESLLVSELGANTRVSESGSAEPNAINALVPKVSTPGIWVRAFLNGNGVTFSLGFLVVSSENGARRIGAFLWMRTSKPVEGNA